MPVSTTQRPGGRNARVRAAVIAAAAAELAEAGYAGMSLESIARRAGVNRTTLYRRWGNREALILDLMLEHAAKVVPVPDTGNLRDDLLEFAIAAVANAATPAVGQILRAAIASASRDPAIAETCARFWDQRMALDGQIVARAFTRGELCRDVAPREVIEAVLGPLHMRLLISGTPPSRSDIARVVDLVVTGVTGR